MYYVTLKNNGETFYLIATTWAFRIERADKFDCIEDAQAAIKKAAQFMKKKQLNILNACPHKVYVANLAANNALKQYTYAAQLAEAAYQTEYFEDLTFVANLRYAEYLELFTIACETRVTYLNMFVG